MALCHEFSDPSDFHKKILESARVSLAFVWLELKNPAPVACLANVVLGQELPTKERDKVISQRLRATMRLYACEAMALMGNVREGMKYIPDNLDELFDYRLDVKDLNRGAVKDAIELSISGMKRLSEAINER
jgi:hypothetical protein